MADDRMTQEATLLISRTYPVPRERAFRAWTQAEELLQWFSPSEDIDVPLAEVDLRVGGRYRIGFLTPDGTLYVSGVYEEIVPSERLVFSWSWEHHEDKDTRVTIEFRDAGDGTEVVLTHERFPDEPMRDEHQKGWTGCMGRLAKRLGAE